MCMCVTCTPRRRDNGTIPGYNDWNCIHGDPAKGCVKKCGGGIYNHSNTDMRKAWVNTMAKAMASGVIDGFFIDITPQVRTTS